MKPATKKRRMVGIPMRWKRDMTLPARNRLITSARRCGPSWGRRPGYPRRTLLRCQGRAGAAGRGWPVPAPPGHPVRAPPRPESRRRGHRDDRRSGERRGTHRLVPRGDLVRMPGLLGFRLGAFLAAAQAGVPVVPIAIRGTRSILRGGQWLPRRGRISVDIAPRSSRTAPTSQPPCVCATRHAPSCSRIVTNPTSRMSRSISVPGRKCRPLRTQAARAARAPPHAALVSGRWRFSLSVLESSWNHEA